MLKTTLCYIVHEGMCLMLFRNRKKKDLNAGKWIGIGGKLEEGESPDECLLREVKEETGITLDSFHFYGIIHFRSEDDEEEMYLYSSSDFSLPSDYEGEVMEYTSCFECSEGDLSWIPCDELMGLSMWEGDRVFLKKMIEGEKRIELTLIYEGERLVSVKEG